MSEQVPLALQHKDLVGNMDRACEIVLGGPEEQCRRGWISIHGSRICRMTCADGYLDQALRRPCTKKAIYIEMLMCGVSQVQGE